ncbi:metallophosphoesterase family protein [Flagellimonas meishanensis]|uniref:metallophosphoesterase family protein n=1 Tax=Flagellimonas meishanensis TaxID=2873264 RepID=UPI001CA6D4DA|nr:metallophosphoesterase [[Muricauda] meishanensis]
MEQPLFTRVHSRELSLWQSSVAEGIRNQLTAENKPAAMQHVLRHPMSIAAAAHVSKLHADPDFVPNIPSKDDGSHEALVYKSHLAFQVGEAMAANNTALAEELTITYRKFSDKDWSVGPPPTGFLSCATTYAKYAILSGHHMTYNDWTVQGNNNIDYGVIQWNLPNDAKVGILGDWGTGLPDAVALLRDMMVQHKPDAIIHLGDIYYSGTPDECHTYFADVFTQVFDEVLGQGNRIPVFSIPGNHDYYAWGAEYYNVVTNLNNYPGGETAMQPASYFCLRTQDGGWQFLGMDTGYNDSNPADQLNAIYAGPWLQNTEIDWLQDKMERFDGASIVLSHHQVFSSNTALNGKYSVLNTVPYFNPYIYRVFSEYMPSKVAGWIWGHEHNFVMYQNNLLALAKGRLVGNSAYEELTSIDPYKVNYPQIPYLVGEPAYDQYKLGTNADSNGITYYNHGYAILDFGGRATPTSPVQASYYQFPAWGDVVPPNPVSTLLFSESFALPQPPPDTGKKIVSQQSLFLINQDGMTVQKAYHGSFNYNYPVLQPITPVNTNAVPLIVTINSNGGGDFLQDGNLINFHSEEGGLGLTNFITAGKLPWLYYDLWQNPGYAIQQWKVHKKNPGGDVFVRVGDPVYLESVAYPGQYLKPVYAKKWGLIYLSTATGMDFFWKFGTAL